MNDTLKVAGRIGAELGAAKTENEKLRKALKRIIDRCEAFVDDEAEMRTPSVEVLMGIAEDAIYTVHEADVALSQQPEPTDTYTAVDMATAAAQGFRDGQAALVEAAQGALSEIQATLEDAYLNAYQECCGQAYLECCGSPLQAWSEADQKIMDRFAPHEKALRHALAAPIAQTAPQPVSSALADLAGDRFEAPVAGWSAPAQDERKTFEAWAKTQGDKWLIVGGLQWSAGTDDYASARTNAAWAAWQERAALSARPAQTEQQPAYVECRECTGCGHVGINDAHPTDATCAMCDWSGPSPVEDQCPDCGKENAMGAACPKCSGRYRILAETHVAAPIAQTAPQGKFRMGDLVKKSTGSEWVGRVVGWYSTEQTKEGYAVESSAHRNSVQIYPATALEAVE